MAEGFLRHLGGDRAEVESAGVTAGGVHPRSVEVMGEAGIDISSHRSKTVEELEGEPSFDLVVTLCDPARGYCLNISTVRLSEEPCREGRKNNPVLAGVPQIIHWDVDDPADAEGSDEEVLEAFRSAREQVRVHVSRLLQDGYLFALAESRERLHLLLDSLEDGVLVHDDHQYIYLFNRAAEKITGYSRDEVIGQSCHCIFAPGGLCGGQCHFQHGPPGLMPRTEQETLFVTKDGDERRIRMTISQMRFGEGRPNQVIATLRDITEVTQLRRQVKRRRSLQGMVAVSSAMQEVFETILQVGASDYPVLILGESGTGKELVANAVHAESRRKGAPFVPINCGALPENILESELFGHVRGAFTGAIRDKKGRFEMADKGTLFLDEVGELTPSFQVKLLRVLQEKRFERVGGERSVQVDVRVIAATNRDLRTMVQEGHFRQDLFYRLCVVPITLPPLRERRDDIPLLVEHVLEQLREETGKDLRTVSMGVMDRLMRYSWPGNVRELINALQYAAVRCSGEEILSEHLPPEVLSGRQPAPSLVQPSFGLSVVAPRQSRRKLDSDTVANALAQTGGNKVQAAKLLGVGRATLYRFLSKNPIG